MPLGVVTMIVHEPPADTTISSTLPLVDRPIATGDSSKLAAR
jgi:hypothetical protein